MSIKQTRSVSGRAILAGWLVLGVATAAAAAGAADTSNQNKQFQRLDQQARSLKSAAIDLMAQVQALQTDSQYPARTRWVVLVTTTPDAAQLLHSISLAVDGKKLATQQYDQQQRQALAQGGAQRLYIGNLTAGRHQVNVTADGHANSTTDFAVAKSPGPHLLELHWQPDNGVLQLTHDSFAVKP